MNISRRSLRRLPLSPPALASGLAVHRRAADEVTIRYLASQGGLAAHELADELGYFDGTGITLENLGYAPGGPASLMALAVGQRRPRLGRDLGRAELDRRRQ